MLVTKQLTVPIDFYSIFYIYTPWKSEAATYCLLTNTLQDSLFCAQQKKETEVWNNFKGK